MSQPTNEATEDETTYVNPWEKTCWGCRDGIANQLGHMDPGGCLYIPSDDEDDNSTHTTDSGV